MYTRPGDTVSLRPYYLPREFPCVVISCVYIAPSTNINTAAELIAGEAKDMLAKYPGAPLFILRDINNCKLHCVVPSFQEYVAIQTSLESILDMCYGNIADMFRAPSYLPVGAADHNIIALLPLYRQLEQHRLQCYSAPEWP